MKYKFPRTLGHLRGMFTGIAIALAIPALTATLYNYFSPGGALSCTSPCTTQSVDLTQSGFVSGPLRAGAGGTGVNTLTGLAVGNGTGAFSAYPGTSCTNQFPRSLSLSGAATCATVANTDLANSTFTLNGAAVALGGTRTLTLPSADFANQGTTTTVLHGNAAGNPAFGSVVSADISGSVGATKGGTGQTNYATGDTLYAPSLNTLAKLTFVATATRYMANTGGAATIPAWDQVNLANGVTGTLPVGNGGTGQTALSALTANPTASLGLTAINGSASTFMRSDAAPALDQTIAPSMSGLWTFTGGKIFIPTFYSVGTCAAAANGTIIIGCDTVPLTNSTVAGKYAIKSFVDATGVSGGANIGAFFFNRSASTNAQEWIEFGNDVNVDAEVMGLTSSTFSGALYTGGPSGKQAFINPASGYPFCVANGSTANLCVGNGSSSITGFGPTANAQVDATPDTGTFTLTYTGMTATVTCTATWSRMGKIVILSLCVATGTSNAVTFTATGVPAAIRPPALTQFPGIACPTITNNSIGLATTCALSIAPSGTITFFNGGDPNGWTAVGTKGVNSNMTIPYQLN